MLVAIEIVAVPEGEAPLWVREAWVGVRLPLMQSEPKRIRTTGVVTGPRGWIGQILAMLFGRTRFMHGYLVESHAAIFLLNERRPDAAEWWRTNTRFAEAGRVFVFDSTACKPFV